MELISLNTPSSPDTTDAYPGRDILPSEVFSKELVEETQRVWRKYYGREISRMDAIEILSNVRCLARAILKMKEPSK
jgi:hypothetical protein